MSRLLFWFVVLLAVYAVAAYCQINGIIHLGLRP